MKYYIHIQKTIENIQTYYKGIQMISKVFKKLRHTITDSMNIKEIPEKTKQHYNTLFQLQEHIENTKNNYNIVCEYQEHY